MVPEFFSMELSNSLGRFRLTALLEGISFLLLLGIAMPLKYIWAWPWAVKYLGWAHGLLFVMYILTLVQVATEKEWKFTKVLIALAAGLFPFGTFWFDRTLQKEN